MPILRSLFIIFITLCSTQAFADWSLNLGYHNPPGAMLGINFLYRSASWGFEMGIGGVRVDDQNTDPDDDDDSDTVALNIVGDINLKYFFGRGYFQPYLQGGFGAALGGRIGRNNDLGAGLGGGFAGLGLLIGGKSLYVYLCALVNDNIDVSPQAGIGFDI